MIMPTIIDGLLHVNYMNFHTGILQIVAVQLKIENWVANVTFERSRAYVFDVVLKKEVLSLLSKLLMRIVW